MGYMECLGLSATGGAYAEEGARAVLLFLKGARPEVDAPSSETPTLHCDNEATLLRETAQETANTRQLRELSNDEKKTRLMATCTLVTDLPRDKVSNRISKLEVSYPETWMTNAVKIRS